MNQERKTEIDEKIREELRKIEQTEKVKVLYAAESGSRAWGVASADSDYDVRFIYARRQEDYLRLEDVRDVIEWQLDAVLDINGWDLKKALRHFHKGNATLFEWCQSPVVYWTTPEWELICGTALPYFSEKAALYHYYGTAKSAYEGYLTGETVKYKKYVYALRPLLACRYIEEKHGIPPVLFEELKQKYLPDKLRAPVEEMLLRKAGSGEREALAQIPEIREFIQAELARIAAVAKEKPEDREADWEPLNRIFRKVIAEILCRT